MMTCSFQIESMQTEYESKLVASSDDKLEEVTRMQQVFQENKAQTDEFLSEIMVRTTVHS